MSELLDGCSVLVTVEDHYLDGGFGERVSVLVAEAEPRIRVARLGLRDIPLCGQNAEVLKAHGLDAASISRFVADVCA